MKQITKIGKKNYRMGIYWAPKYFWTTVGLLKNKEKFINDCNKALELEYNVVLAKERGIEIEMVDMDIVNDKLRLLFDVKGYGPINARIVSKSMQKNIINRISELGSMEKNYAEAVYHQYQMKVNGFETV